jgi:phosphoribosylamine--glycine ligase
MEEQQPNIQRVLVIGFAPSTVQLARALAMENPRITFDVLVGETQSVEENLPNLVWKQLDFNYVIDVNIKVTAQNAKRTQETKRPGKFTLGYSVKEYINQNLDQIDFIIATNAEFQRWKWFQNLKLVKPVFCPNAQSSDLEHDKLFAKQILNDAGVPTPNFTVLERTNLSQQLDQLPLPIVLKCNIAFSHQGFSTWVFKDRNYRNTVTQLLAATKKIPDAQFYVEDFITGPEISAHFLVSIYYWEYMGSARDYKKRKNNDEGMNTSGAGSYAPAETWTDEIKDQVFSYMDKIVGYLNMLGIVYKGVMYLGVIIDDQGQAQILEINTRPGTPEFMAILPTLDNSNLLENLYRSAIGAELLPINKKDCVGVAVSLMNRMYTPELKFDSIEPTLSDLPADINSSKYILLYTEHNMYTVLSTTGNTREEAAGKIYDYLETIDTKDFTYRTDIGFLK